MSISFSALYGGDFMRKMTGHGFNPTAIGGTSHHNNQPTSSGKSSLAYSRKIDRRKVRIRVLVEDRSLPAFEQPVAIPLHLVPKKDSSWRTVADYRRLYAITRPDRYPMKHIEDVLAGLAGKSIFSNIYIYILRAFHQIHIAESEIPKTAVITPFCLYEFQVITFHGHLRGFDFCVSYADDILVSSVSLEQHEQNLRILLERLNSHIAVINTSKCIFSDRKVECLGHTINQDGIMQPALLVKALRNFPESVTFKELRSFLGALDYYRHFIPNAANLQAPLNDMLCLQPKNHNVAIN